jgi:hypothetical protein
MLELENAKSSQTRISKKLKVDVLVELERLEEEIFQIEGKEREKAIETYRELLRLLEDEPIYFSRY